MPNKKEITKEYNKEYYIVNKEKHLAYIAECIKCLVCDCTYTRCKRVRHMNTQKHKKNELIKMI
jgi:hypothetical protein